MNFEQFQCLLADDKNVSRETFEYFQTWHNLLNVWNKKINLVSPTTMHDFWLRHALDSWQIVRLLPDNAKTILDMGAGAGFPGLALAIALKNTPDAQITLVESNGKKCNFLHTVIRECALPAKAVQTRVENLEPKPHQKPYDIITARAFAPLPKLLDYSLPFWRKDKISENAETKSQTTAIYPKGAHWQDEVSAARKLYDFDLSTTNSQTHENAKILTITNLAKHEKMQ